MNNKAMFFTLLAITFLSILLVVVTPPLPQDFRKESEQIRITEINEAIGVIEEGYLPIALRAATAISIQRHN